MQPSIFKYLDYRQYLKDFLAHKRETSPTFSLEQLGRRTGCLTKSHISLIVSGKRALTTKRATALAMALGMNSKEISYYHKLIQFNQAKEPAEKEHFLCEMMSQLGRSMGENISMKSYKVLEEWHGLAIVELARLPEFDPNPQMISARLKGLLSAQEAKRAVQLLLDVGMLKYIDDGAIVATDQTIRTSDEVNSLAIRRYHKSCLELGKKIIEIEPVTEREFGSVNVLIKPDDIQKLKDLIKNFREQVLALAQTSSVENASVTQVNVQMFKVSH
jgi:uncharacterized protein (TIGR02147 family)